MAADESPTLDEQDARELYMLLGECRALGRDGLTWRRHLVNQLPRLFDADMAYFLDNRIVGKPESPEGWIRPISVVDHWPTSAERESFLKFMRDGRHERTPMAQMINGINGFQVAARQDFCSDEEWREHPFNRDYVAPCNLDEFVHGVNQVPDGLVQIMSVQRLAGRPPFPKRAVLLMKALWAELRRLQSNELAQVDESAFMIYPKRMLQVLACLLSGYTAKEAASQLGISVHTIQEHIKRLYKRSGTSNRSELADCFRDVAPFLLSLPFDKFPDYKQEIEEVTRKPWPASPGSVEN